MFDITKKRHRFRLINPVYPAFNIYSNIADKTTALGPVCIATTVNKMENWDVEVIDENNLRGYGPRGSRGANHEYLQQERPADVVGFYGGLTSTIPRLYDVARFYKERGVITIAGGQHFAGDNIREALESGIDYVVIGEGEETIKELLKSFTGTKEISQIPGIAYLKEHQVMVTAPREPITDFDALPIPDFSLVRYARIKMYPIGKIRGCGMDCEFCAVKGKPRCASSERLLEQIKVLLETYDARHFFIIDDLFGQYRDETIRFCHMLRDYQLRTRKRLDVTVQIRLDNAKDPELLKAMRSAGINTVAIGFESPIEEELKAMNKRLRPEDMIELARVYHRFGFLVHGMFIFGYPFKEASAPKISLNERIKRYRTFIKKAKIDTIQVLLPVPLPGTQLRDRLQHQNRVYPLADIGWEYYDGNFPIFEPDAPLSAQELQVAMHKIMGRFYQLKYMFMIGIHVFTFPAMIFFLHNIKSGWRQWYRPWRNSLARFGGWIVMKGWTQKFKKSTFLDQLKEAQTHVRKNRP
ncbi:MAG: B12-binding domain-containing radical SAM protein [Candidatus Omnitrophica bacterium]|nr:B12-binding domain-containing radical SAM protein [Candidatus Omnitrophota bacterium]